MAGSPISAYSQYADALLTEQIMGPRVQFLLDATVANVNLTTLASIGYYTWTMPTKGQIVKAKYLVNTDIVCPAVAYLYNTALSTMSIPNVPTFPLLALGKTYSVTVTSATPGVFTWAAHGLQAGWTIKFTAATTIPTGLTAGTTYYVSAFGLTANTFQVANTWAYAVAATDATNSVGTSSTGVGTVTAVANASRGTLGMAVAAYSGGAVYDEGTVFATGLGTGLSPGTGSQSTVTMTYVTAGVITWPGSDFAADTPIVFGGTGTYPPGITAGTVYYVKATGLLPNSFNIAAAPGDGPAINTTGGSPTGTFTAYAAPAITAGSIRMELQIQPMYDPMYD